MTDIKPRPFPRPGELDILQRPPLLRRCRSLLGQMRLSGRVRFVVLFLAFVLAGTLVMFLLEGGREGSPFGDVFNSLWFTVVTITTVGYGDIFPTIPLARLLAMVEMLVGVGLVAIITGAVASLLVEGNRRRALGLVAIPLLRNHMVVCGWKPDLREFLLGMMETNRWLRAHHLVLVTTRPPNEVEELKRERRLRGLHYVYGNPADRAVLEMARVKFAERVIILAEDSGRGGRDDPDSRTVLAATAVEAVSPEVYTCTEIVRPHFVPYLRPARVEEVVLSRSNAHALIVAASLGDGLANVFNRFFPENGQQLRILPIPATLQGRKYGEIATAARSQGYLPIGLVENTGRLHDRRRERINEALREADYPRSVEMLRTAARLESNSPRFLPPGEAEVPAHARLMALLPAGTGQAGGDRDNSAFASMGGRARGYEHLVICGWKTGMAELLAGMADAHRARGRTLGSITIVGDPPGEERAAVSSLSLDAEVRIVPGEPTDPRTLEAAGLRKSARVLVLTDPGAEAGSQQADARSVMISFAINEFNPALYKCVEIINPNLTDHLLMSNVEEVIQTRQYQRMMLVQASLGTGLPSAVRAMADPVRPLVRVVDFPTAPPGTSISEYAAQYAAAKSPTLAAGGGLLIGVIEQAGNNHERIAHSMAEAQRQPQVAVAVEQLRALRRVVSNHPVLNPGPGFVPGPNCRAIVLASAHQEGAGPTMSPSNPGGP